MPDIILSVIIPSYKDPLLLKTIDSLLVNSALGDALEIIAVMDGYWQAVQDNKQVRVVHLGHNRGMRRAINAGVSVSRGKFIMRTDEHCMFGNGFDKIMCDSCDPNWIMTARRYFLDPVNWEVMDKPYVDYEKLVIDKREKFTGDPWRSRTLERQSIPVDETMAMQGSMWLMPRAWWDSVIGELQTDGYGPHYQDSHELVFKTWKAGGKLMLNKNTWFAHKHRSYPRTHNEGTVENPSNKHEGWKYALDTWKDYYYKDILPAWTTSP